MKLFGKEIELVGPVHFIGIGGIGMAALAEILARAGAKVQGSDLAVGYSAPLEALGVTVHEGHDVAHLGNARMVVVSSAIRKTNPELVEAEKRGLTVIHRADLLAAVMANYKCIVVAGTHGKTSTTSLMYAALKAAGANVGVITGGVLDDIGSPVAMPPKAGAWLVVEADESDASFLKLPVDVAVVLNIEPEHMEAYGGDEAKLSEAFTTFISKAEAAIVCGDDSRAVLAASAAGGDVITYGIADGADYLDVYSDMYTPQGRGMAFDAIVRGGRLEDVVVSMPGQHYVSNALAVLAVAHLLKLDIIKAAEGLATFAGVGRRFSFAGTLFGEDDGPDVIDDYGHHPTEIKATLAAAKNVYPGRVVAVIEPHRYTRLRDLMEQFAACAVMADACLLLPVFAAGEDPIDGISSEMLATHMQAPPTQLVQDAEELAGVLGGMQLGKGDAVIVLGAGTSSRVAKELGTAA